MKIAAGVEYRGHTYSGWQKQTHSPSIQEQVESALSSVANQPVAVTCAGRTDAGVHALNQVIHFETDALREDRAWVFGGNTYLPGDIALTWARAVAADFHARYRALSRLYQYIILNRPARPALNTHHVAWEPRALDPEKMSQAALSLTGEHDFTSYRAKSCQATSPIREIKKIAVRREGEYIYILIEANAFLHHMVRNIAGVLMAIGMGRQKVGWEMEVLKAKDRAHGGVTAAASGLYLLDVNYPEKYGIPKARQSPVFEWV